MRPGVPFLLTIAELAVLLRREPQTVHRMIRDGQLPIDVVVLGGTRHVRRTDAEAFLGAEITLEDLNPQAVAS